MDPIFETEYSLTALHCDRFGRLKPSAILYLVQETVGEHCRLLQLDLPHLSPRGLFWAITRHRLQIRRLPVLGETLHLQTWPMPTTRVAYPRSVVAYDQKGEECFRSVSLWVLMDANKRAMVLPGKSGIAVPGLLRGDELPVPGSLVPQPLENRAQRRVCFTDLDCNGHMNNARYLDWAMDLLPSDFHRQHTLRDMTLGYVNEAREGDLLTLGYQVSQQGQLELEIRRQQEDQANRIFCARIDFEKG